MEVFYVSIFILLSLSFVFLVSFYVIKVLKKKCGDNKKIKKNVPIIEVDYDNLAISVTGFTEVATTVGEIKREEEDLEKHRKEIKEIEDKLIEENIIWDINRSLLSIKELNEADYHKVFIEKFKHFEQSHYKLLHIAKKDDYLYYKKKSVDYYKEHYDEKVKSYQLKYLSNPSSINLREEELRCFENTYSQFRDYWSIQLTKYKQRAAKRKRIFYLIEHTDIFISHAKNIGSSSVITQAKDSKKEYSTMLENL